MESHFGLVNLWQQGDAITRSVVVLLLAMSLASWTVIAVKAIGVLRIKRLASRAESFWHSSDLTEGLVNLGPARDNPFRFLAEEGRNATAHHSNTRAQLHDALDISDWVTRCLRNAVDDAVAGLQSGLAILASVGSTAPFVGLFGTVWGIYHALMGISATGQASIDAVSGPIGEALIMTALGLAVAIPAVLGYNALVRGNKAIVSRLNRFAHDLHAYFVTGARVNMVGTSIVVPLKREPA
jgi:biopolymer transport protein ExbB